MLLRPELKVRTCSRGAQNDVNDLQSQYRQV